MNPDQFISKYLGKTKGYPTDSQYLGQCLSAIKLYIKECFGILPPASGSGSAYGYWSNFPSPLGTVFKKVPNTPDLIPEYGWIVIWKPWTTNKYGHIAIVDKGCTKTVLKNIAQNWTSKVFQRESQSYNNVKGFLVPIKNETMPNLSDEIIGKASQRDKVVNHYKFEIGTAKDDELLVKVKDIIKQSDDKAKDCNKKLSDIVENTTKEVVEEINKAFENPQKEPKVATIKNAIGGLRGLITIKEGELEAKQKELDECKNLPTDPLGYSSGEVGKELMRWLVVGLFPATLTYLGTIQAEWAIVATVALKLIDKSIHEYGKAIDKDWLIKGLTRF